MTTFGNSIIVGTRQYPYHDTGAIYVSTNLGVNWVKTLNNGDVLAFTVSGSNIYAGIHTGIYVSSNAGLNWAHISSEPSSIVVSLLAAGTRLFAGTNGNGIYISTNNGVNWTQAAFSGQGVNSWVNNGTYIFAGMGLSGVYRSSDSGITWTQTSLNNKGIQTLETYGQNIFASTSYDGLIFSSNNGMNWAYINQGFYSIPDANSFLINNNYILVGTDLCVWRRPLLEIIGIQNISSNIPDKYYLYQNYPNPFNPNTTIKFSIPMRSPTKTQTDQGQEQKATFGDDRVVLKVYDMLGKEVTTLVNAKLSPGIFEVNWDASAYPSGIYFYRLISDDYVQTKKMILLK